MKTKLLLSALVLFISTGIFAQKIQAGFKVGATVNKLSGKTFKEQFSFGYHTGAFVSVGLGKKFALQPEVMLNQINLDTSSAFSSIYKFNKINKVQLKYLSIPVLLNYNANKLITLQAGPQFGILMNKSNTFFENSKQAFKSGDLAMLGGVQINVAGFKVYGRYTIGLSNINDIDNKDKWKSQSVQIGVGFKL